MSQEELAERTGLSVRTIQRIENGETQPRGDSLRRLCQALGVEMEVLVAGLEGVEVLVAGSERVEADGTGGAGYTVREGMDVLREEPGPEDAAGSARTNGLKVDRGFLVVLNLSALAFLLPWEGIGIIAPLILWLLYRDKIEGVRLMGRRIINFQITWLLIKGLIYGSMLLLAFNHLPLPGLTAEQFAVDFWLFMRVLDAFNINCIIVNAIRASKKKGTNYAPAIRFLGA